jgi:acetoin utilization protein AcuB
MSDPNNWMTTSEAAARLGVTPARIRQMVAEGQLSGIKMGGKYRGQWQIKAGDIEEKVHLKGVTGTMRVKNRMTPNPLTATLKTNYNQALRLMQQNKIKSLPVVDSHGKLIGIVTHSDMLRAEPSPVTTLGVYEMASLLERVTMDKIMSSPVLAVDESCSITNAANFMLLNDIGCLPVSKDGKLTGIITDTDIFRTFVDVTGGGQAGSRIEVRMPDQKGQLAPFIAAFTQAGSYIVSVSITYDKDGEHAFVDIKERGGDEDAIREGIKKLGNVEIIEFRPGGRDKLLKFE